MVERNLIIGAGCTSLTTANQTLDSQDVACLKIALLLGGEEALDSERGRLMRRRDQLRQEIQTYENNLGFLNASSKKGNSLIDEMNRKVQKLRDDLDLVCQKIKAVNSEKK